MSEWVRRTRHTAWQSYLWRRYKYRLPTVIGILILFLWFRSISIEKDTIRRPTSLKEWASSSNAKMATDMHLKSSSSSSFCHPCIISYMETLTNLGVTNGKLSDDEWQAALCDSSVRTVSNKPLIFGVGPGTTATKSVALAVSLLGKTVLHYKAVRTKDGELLDTWKDPQTPVVNAFSVPTLVEGMRNRTVWNSIHTSMDFASILNSVDAVFDYPFPMYALEVLRAFPNAKVILTHRDPTEWYERRLDFCTTRERVCRVPFVLRPLSIYMNDTDTVWSKSQVVAAYEATETVLECLITGRNRDRFLKVDVWNPPPQGWMPVLAEFLGITPIPSPESGCVLPTNTSGGLKCQKGETACETCDAFFGRDSKEP